MQSTEWKGASLYLAATHTLLDRSTIGGLELQQPSTVLPQVVAPSWMRRSALTPGQPALEEPPEQPLFDEKLVE